MAFTASGEEPDTEDYKDEIGRVYGRLYGEIEKLDKALGAKDIELTALRAEVDVGTLQTAWLADKLRAVLKSWDECGHEWGSENEAAWEILLDPETKFALAWLRDQKQAAVREAVDRLLSKAYGWHCTAPDCRFSGTPNSEGVDGEPDFRAWCPNCGGSVERNSALDATEGGGDA